MKRLLTFLLFLLPLFASAQPVSFTVSADTLCWKMPANFSNTTPGSFDSLRWVIDGLASSAHSSSTGTYFDSAGNHYVSLFIYRSGVSDSASRVIYQRSLVPLPILTDSAGWLVLSGSVHTVIWYFNGHIIPGMMGRTLQITDTGSYYAVVDTVGGCYSVITDTVTEFPAIANHISFPSPTIVVYPNPAFSTLTITASYPVSSVAVTSHLGQLIGTYHFITNHVQINVADLPAGIYFVRINGTEVRKFVKE